MQDVFHELADPKLLQSMESFFRDLNEMWTESGVIYSDPPSVPWKPAREPAREPRYVRPASSAACQIWDACGFRFSERYVTIEHGLTKWAHANNATYVGKDGTPWVTWTVNNTPCHSSFSTFLKWFIVCTKVEGN